MYNQMERNQLHFHANIHINLAEKNNWSNFLTIILASLFIL